MQGRPKVSTFEPRTTWYSLANMNQVCVAAALLCIACSGERPTFPSSRSQTSSDVDAGNGKTTSNGHESSDSEGSSEPAASGSNTTLGPSPEEPCPEAPGGVCECKANETQKCSASGAKGACADGTQRCTSDGVFGACDIRPAASDDCSIEGDDSDCDGTPNSGCPCVDGATQECGPDTDEGACKYGLSTCTEARYGECVGAVERGSRQCDSTQDNDCDGEPDNTLDDTCKCEPGAIRQCNAHPGFDGVGPCRPGSQTCELNEKGDRSDWGPCSGDIAPAEADSCIEGDNSDCIGTANTNCTCVAGKERTCGDLHDAKGVCAQVDVTCEMNGTWPSEEICTAAAVAEDCKNNLDDNCDGTVNEANSCPCNQVPSPCVHGTCNAGTADAYTCDCTGTGYEGTSCDKPVALTVAGPSDATSCEVVGVSDDGTVVAANCDVGESSLRPYFWRANAWIKASAPSGYSARSVVGLSSDGTKAAGALFDSNSVIQGCQWTDLTAPASLLHTPEWKAITAMSANGNSFSALDPGGNLFVWTGGGGSAPITYITNGGVPGIFSGDGTKVFTPAQGDDEGFRIWTSPTTSTLRTLAADLEPIAASNDGSVMVGRFYDSTLSTMYKYSSSSSSTLDATEDCVPSSISFDGRYILGRCPNGLYRWADRTPSSVQSLLASTGSTATLRTDVDGTMSYNAKYVALPSSSNGIVVVHLPSP